MPSRCMTLTGSMSRTPHTRSRSEDSLRAIMVTRYHWGLLGWSPYNTMDAVLGIMPYRRGYPLTVHYCFYPLLGDVCYGLLGDIVDIFSIISTIAGVCTLWGLGAMQIITVLQRLSHDEKRKQDLELKVQQDHMKKCQI